MRSVSGVGRFAALGAVVGAVVLVAVILFGGGGGGGYELKAVFINANQLVNGNTVQVGGLKAGTVKDIAITDDGQAEITMEIDEKYAPIPRGTEAVIRQVSQSSIAGRYVDLVLPGKRRAGAGESGETAGGGAEGGGTSERGRGTAEGGGLPDGAVLGVDETTTGVDLDQLFNTLDPETRRSLQRFFKGSSRQYAGRGGQANLGFLYLNPALSTSSRLFNELNRDTPSLERFLVNSSRLVTAVAERRDDLAALISNLNATTRAIGNQKAALADAIVRFPDFMRRANTTFVNLRATLDDVDPLVDASKPVARRLRRFLPQLRQFARDARPTVRDLSLTIRRDGDNNDLIELTRSFGPLEDIAVETRRHPIDVGNGPVDTGVTRGAFPEIAEATTKTAPIIAFGRPFTPDFAGWWDDFSNTGGYDALGGISRTMTVFNAFVFQDNSLFTCPPALSVGGVCNLFGAAGLALRGTAFKAFAATQQTKRCPGHGDIVASDGSNVYPTAEARDFDGDGSADCDPTHRAAQEP